MNMRIQVKAGERYGRLTVIEEVEPCGGRRRFACKCDCGKVTAPLLTHLRAGRSVSCGCIRGTHRNSRTPTYKVWVAIKQRCCNPTEDAYRNYGARGIGMCIRWHDSFEAFLEDMGERPDGHSIDRIDNNKGYFKKNCRWATRVQQNRNTRRNIFVTLGGKTMTLVQWSEETGINYATLWHRIHFWNDVERALTQPVDKGKWHGKTQKN